MCSWEGNEPMKPYTGSAGDYIEQYISYFEKNVLCEIIQDIR